MKNFHKASSYLFEGPTFIFKVHTNFVWMPLDISLKDLGDSQVPLLIDVDQDEKLKISPCSPGISACSVIEKVQCVVATSDQVGQEQGCCCHICSTQLRIPAPQTHQIQTYPRQHDCSPLSARKDSCVSCVCQSRVWTDTIMLRESGQGQY